MSKLFITNVDLLRLSFLTTDRNFLNQIAAFDEFTINQITLIKENNYNSNFANNYMVYYKNIAIGILKYNSFNPNFREVIKFTFLNNFLYSRMINPILNIFATDLKLIDPQISRLDIAVDYINQSSLITNIRRNYINRPNDYLILENNKIKKSFDRSCTDVILKNEKTNKKYIKSINSLYFGNDNIKLVMYDKLFHLNHTKDKLYLLDYYKDLLKQNGLNEEIKSVERIEVRINKSSFTKYTTDLNKPDETIKEIKNIDVYKLDDINYLNDLFNYYLNDILQIKKIKYKTGKNGKQLKSMIPIKNMKNVKLIDIKTSHLKPVNVSTTVIKKQVSKRFINDLQKEIEFRYKPSLLIQSINNKLLKLGLDLSDNINSPEKLIKAINKSNTKKDIIELETKREKNYTNLIDYFE